MDRPYAVPFRGHVEANFTAGQTLALTLFDHDGTLRTLAATERLDVTDISYRAAVVTVVHVFFDMLGDGSYGQNAAPTLAHAAAGTGIAAATYTLGITYFDPFTNSETPLSATANVTTLAGDNITVTAPVAIPPFMVDRNGNQGYIKVYRNDGGGQGLVGKSAPGQNSVVLTSVAVSGSLPTSGANASGKNVGTAYLSANAPWSDCFETGKIGPKGIGLKATSSVAGQASFEVSGRILTDQQLP